MPIFARLGNDVNDPEQAYDLFDYMKLRLSASFLASGENYNLLLLSGTGNFRRALVY